MASDWDGDRVGVAGVANAFDAFERVVAVVVVVVGVVLAGRRSVVDVAVEDEVTEVQLVLVAGELA